MQKISFLLILLIIFSCINGCGDDLNGAVHKIYKIGFSKDTVYVNARMWGLLGDHIEIFFSPKSFDSKQFDSSLCFTYFDEPTIYYKTNGDTLELYPTQKTVIPKMFSPTIKIKEIVINKFYDINRYKERYQEYGLGKISVYE
jgi:hypothetical protein